MQPDGAHNAPTTMNPTLLEQARVIARGDLSARQCVQSALERIAMIDSPPGGVGAFLSVQAEAALARADQIDADRAAGRPLGRLAGVPIAIKDNLCLDGTPTTCASRMLENFVAPYTATVLHRLAAEGAILLGKTNLDEFAMGASTEYSALQKTRNPWDLGRVVGGSSGGSAAAVAAGLVAGSLGSDTGGSIRQPAALCGITGLKPTYGRVSRSGLVAFASSLDQIGPMAHTVEDCAALLGVIAGRDPRDSTSLATEVPDYLACLASQWSERASGLRIGIAPQFYGEGVEPAVLSAVDAAVEQLCRLGAKRVEISLPNAAYGIATYYIICTAEASSNLARYDGAHYGHRTSEPAPAGENQTIWLYSKSRSEGFGHEVRKRIMLGTYVLSSGYYDAYYLRASKVRRLIRNEFEAAFGQCDLIALPTSPTTAWRFGQLDNDPLAMYLADIFTVNASLAGLPAISLPCGFDQTEIPGGSGLPIGLQLIGPALSEPLLLATGHAYQQHTDWHLRTPPAIQP